MYVRDYELRPRAIELVRVELTTAQLCGHRDCFLLYVVDDFVKRHHQYVFLASRVLHLNQFVKVIYVYTQQRPRVARRFSIIRIE